MFGRLALLSLAAAGCGLTVTGCVSRSYAQTTKAQTPDRQVQLTVYKNDFAMVHESRPVTLTAGSNDVQLASVSDKLDPSSVLFTWDHPGSAEVVSNTYNLGLADSQSLLKRYVGQQVDVVRYGQDGHAADQTTGTLEMANSGEVVLQAGNKLMVNPPGTVIAPNRPDIVAASQLSIGVESRDAQQTSLGMAYLTGGLGWNADYVAHIDPDKDFANVECWATVTNHTGITFPKAKITLMAGSPNKAVTAPMAPMPKTEVNGNLGGLNSDQTVTRSYDASGFARKRDYAPVATGELYAYPIDLPATIAPEEMNRVRMISAQTVPIQKDYSVRLRTDAYGTEPIRQNATLTVNFTNSTESHLGQPLPAGTVRAYQADGNGADQYIGAADVQDTPKDRLVSLTLSDVFDVTSETKVVKTTRVDKRHVAITYSVNLGNGKASPLSVRVVSGFYGINMVESETIKSRKLTSGDRQWMVPVPAHGHTVLTYTVILTE